MFLQQKKLNPKVWSLWW